VLFKQNVGRAVSSWSHRQPLHYYLVRIPGDFFPWSLLLPVVSIWAWREAKTRKRRDAGALLAWAGLGLLVFSLISGKRERYLLPFHPAAALATAAYLRAMVAGSPIALAAWARGLLAAALACFGVLALALSTLALAGPRLLSLAKEDDARLVGEALVQAPSRAGALVAGAAILAAVGAGVALLRRGKPGGAVQATLVCSVLLSLAFDLVLAPAIDVVKSPRPVAERIQALVPEGEGEVALYPNEYSGAYNLYTGRVHMPVLSGPAAVAEFLRRPGRRAIVTTDRVYDRERADWGVPHDVVDAGFVGSRHIVLILPDEDAPR
jgi:4-amino-4-deoxy-L-arabinose transferase-like glycosyltransferase